MPGQGYLLDTNALSDWQKPRPSPAVLATFSSLTMESCYVSVLTIGELRRGAAKKLSRHPAMSSRYALWIGSLERMYGSRILPIDRATATLWGELGADRTRPVVDTLLAATAILHDLTLVTRNVRNLAGLPVRTLNPWSS